MFIMLYVCLHIISKTQFFIR